VPSDEKESGVRSQESGVRRQVDEFRRDVTLRACDFFRMGSVGRGVEGDGEGQGGGWERVRGVLEINFSGFPQIFYKLPGFSCWYLLIHDTMPVCTILYRWMIFI